ncbi:tripartite tricarboxylate transporter permease [Halocatena marina]|uniref:tripartite tricarboxylate transporter permease n=1 Tax=Halocatena marina TaxID=2934937 RepID=UPI0022259BBD|nr:tripartite tricarboxylate transporter permease [Halocatena marina]
MAFSAHVVFAPDRTVAVFAFVLAGVVLGTVSGLIPGIHANNMAFVLAAVAPSIPGPPTLVGSAMLAAGVVHTFLDIIPALALGVPDPAMAASALPGHRLVLEGRGGEALRLSALGSGLAIVLAVPLSIPVTEAMVTVYPTISAHLSIVLGSAALLLIWTESTQRGRVGGVVAFASSTGLGLLTLDLSVQAPLDVGSMLTPLFTGLFGAPVLLEAMGGNGVPEQVGVEITLSRRIVGGLGTIGTVCGAVVGYIPGVSSAIAATLALVAVPGRYGGRGFIVATSGVNTANTVFALFALVALGSPRTGVLVALERANVPLDLPILLVAVGFAAVAGFSFVLLIGDAYLSVIGSVGYTKLSICVFALLCVVSYLFAGLLGVGVFAASTVVGLVPARFGAQRAHLMGVLMGPLIVGGYV